MNNQQPDVKVLSVTGGEGKQTSYNDEVVANLRQDDDTLSLTSPADTQKLINLVEKLISMKGGSEAKRKTK